MAYCGNCGNSFEPSALVNGRCPACGARISATGNVVGIDQVDTVPMREPLRPLSPPPLPSAADDPMALPAPAAAERMMVRVDPHNVVVLDQRTSHGTSLILMLLALAALLLLIGGAVLLGAKWSQSPLSPVALTATANATVSVTVAATVSVTSASTSSHRPAPRSPPRPRPSPLQPPRLAARRS